MSLLTIVVSVAFAWILWPFSGAILWAVVLATIFAPTYQWLLVSLKQRRNLAAVITLAIVVTMVILPLALTIASLMQESASLDEKRQSGELDFARFFQRFLNSLPDWLTNLLAYFGVNDLGDVQQRLSGAMKGGSQFVAEQVVAIGQSTAHFIISVFLMLYLLFNFSLRGLRLKDGNWVSAEKAFNPVPSIRSSKPALPLFKSQRPGSGQSSSKAARGHYSVFFFGSCCSV